MEEIELTQQLVKAGEKADEGYFDYAAVVARRLPKHLHESLQQLIDGPVWDGDVISKAYRSELFELGLAVRVCLKGEQGYTGATYFAYTVMRMAAEIADGMRGSR